MTKREKILVSAANVIKEKGVNQLTLDAVALEAGVSKGGLLYHFRNKEELIKGMSVYAMESFRKDLEKELNNTTEQKGKFLRAYAEATLKQLSDVNQLNINSSLLATIATNEELLTIQRDEYQNWVDSMAKEDIDPELVSIIRLVCDGLFYSQMFDLSPLSAIEQRNVMNYLLSFLDKNSDFASEEK